MKTLPYLYGQSILLDNGILSVECCNENHRHWCSANIMDPPVIPLDGYTLELALMVEDYALPV